MIEYMNEEWFTVLKAEIAKSSMSKIARKIGYSPTSISLILNGKYAGKPDKVAQKVLEIFTKVSCPYERAELPRSGCIEIALSPAPTHNPIKMQHWRACQKCPKRPSEK